MNLMDLNSALEIKTFGFNVPCREFVISAQVTRDRRMPMVDEFLLRVLYTVEVISINRLARYFGFEGQELSIVLTDLQNRSLIIITNEDVQLHPSAKELFRTSGDSQPAITSVDSLHARVWFDLISQNMVSSRGRHNVKHLLPLSASSERMDMEASFAREAFDSNFKDYLKNNRKVRNPDQWALYAILDVIVGRFSYAQIYGSESLNLKGAPKLETTLLPQDSDRPNKLKLLTEAMSQGLGKLVDPMPSLAAKTEYIRVSGDSFIEETTSQAGYLNLQNWLTKHLEENDSYKKAFIGYPYIERNRKLLQELLSTSFDRENEEAKWNLFWLRPGGTSWGITEDINLFLSELRTQIRKRSSNTETLITNLIVPASMTHKTARLFDRIFDNGYQTKSGSFPLGMEIVLIPNVIAIISTMASLSEDTRIPVGIMTTDSKKIERIVERYGLQHIAPNYGPLWKPRPNNIDM